MTSLLHLGDPLHEIAADTRVLPHSLRTTSTRIASVGDREVDVLSGVHSFSWLVVAAAAVTTARSMRRPPTPGTTQWVHAAATASSTCGEVCDDGNAVAGDGCAADCATVEAGHACGNPGDPCVVTHVCGNGLVEDIEGCDDHNTASGDGCHSDCTLEAGWRCDVAGIRCSAAQCGDGIVAGYEECDDGAATTPGCSATCTLEDGYQCPTANAACTPDRVR